MKKVIILLLCLLLIDTVYAKEELSKDDISIKYKWYKEIITDEMFYPKKDSLDDYLENSSKVEYGEYTRWDNKYCNYSKDNYVIESKTKNSYKIVGNTRYIKISNASTRDKSKINIFSEKNIVNFEIIKENEEGIIIKLDNIYNTYNLWFYIDLDKEYTITLSYYENFSTETLSKTINNIKLLVPDHTWKTQKTSYIEIITESQMDTNSFITALSSETICRLKEIKTYRYKLKKVYYDENYYENIEGYIPDINDYIVEYYGKEQANITEIAKEIEKDIKEKQDMYLNNNKIISPSISQYNCPENYQKLNNFPKTSNIKYISNTNIIEKNTNKEIIKRKKSPYIMIIAMSILLVLNAIITIFNIHSKKSNEINI